MNKFESKTLTDAIGVKFEEIMSLIKKEVGDVPELSDVVLTYDFPQPLKLTDTRFFCEFVEIDDEGGELAERELEAVRSSCVYVWKWVFRNGQWVRIRVKVN